MEEIYKLASSLVSYDPKTGEFIWLQRPVEIYDSAQSAHRFNSTFAGNRADHFDKINGYMRVGVSLNKLQKQIRAHRLAWFISNGSIPEFIDHINGNRSDNRLCNLRNVSRLENARNLGLSKLNSSGVVGVNYCNTRMKWVAKGFYNGRRKHLGYFEKFEDARHARQVFNDANGYHCNHGHRDGWVRKADG